MANPAQAAITVRMTIAPTHHGGQMALHLDLREATSHPRSARTALWVVSIERQRVDSSPPYDIEPGMSPPRRAACPHGRCVSHPPRDHTDEGPAHVPPCWHDGTERTIHRPIDPEDQQEYSSGKQKCHTINNRLMIDETGHICFLGATSEGKANDKSLADLEGSTLPHGSCLYQDMGFQGYTRDGIIIFQPRKNPLVGNSPHRRTLPIVRSSLLESVLNTRWGGVKRYRMVKDKIRLLKDGIRDTIMETCCGLHNFRLQYRPWHYAN
jgi:hypothetical protein